MSLVSRFKAWQRRNRQMRLAGMIARLAACRELANQAERIPGAVVQEMMELPQEIAELQFQLKEDNAKQNS